MANVLAPFGLSQIGIADGSPANFAMVTRGINQSSQPAAIYKGDPVIHLSSGYIGVWTPGSVVGLMVGIFNGCTYTTSQGIIRSPYWPGTGSGALYDAYAEIIPISMASGAPQFVAQTANSNTTASAASIANIGDNVDVAMGTGSTITGFSGAYIDLYTATTTATLPFRIIGLWSGGIYSPTPTSPYGGTGNGSDTTTAYNYVIVVANNIQATGI